MLSVLSWNVHGLPFRGNTPRRMVRVAERINAERPDIALLQEVWLNRYRRILSSHLGPTYNFIYAPRRYTRRPRGGLLVLVRRDGGWRATAERTFTTFEARAPWYRLREADGISGKGVLSVVLVNGRQAILLSNTHLQAQYGARLYHAERRAQLDQLVGLLGSCSDHPHLIAGDFNTTADEELYTSHLISLGTDLTEHERRLCASGTHFDERGGGRKWIDYVFGRNLPAGVEVVRIQNEAADDPYSDHDGLLVRWRFPAE